MEKLPITYKAQSTAMMRVMSSVGRPTEVSTITMVTSPACGIPAAPILAAVAVMLREQTEEQSAFISITYRNKCLSKNYVIFLNWKRKVRLFSSLLSFPFLHSIFAVYTENGGHITIFITNGSLISHRYEQSQAPHF